MKQVFRKGTRIRLHRACSVISADLLLCAAMCLLGGRRWPLGIPFSEAQPSAPFSSKAEVHWSCPIKETMERACSSTSPVGRMWRCAVERYVHCIERGGTIAELARAKWVARVAQDH